MIGILNTLEIDDVLRSNVLGRIGCRDGEKIYVVPVSYVYDGKYIICHSAEGMKIHMMRKTPAVCFEVDEMKDYTNWRSVIGWGAYEELTDDTVKYRAMEVFVDRLMHMKISETARPPEMLEKRVHPRSPGNIKPVIFRIELKERSGRYENDKD